MHPSMWPHLRFRPRAASAGEDVGEAQPFGQVDKSHHVFGVEAAAIANITPARRAVLIPLSLLMGVVLMLLGALGPK